MTKKMNVRDYILDRYLAKTIGPSISILSTYIVFFTKMQKRQSPKMRFAFLISENTTSRFLANRKIYCRYSLYH